MVYEKPSADVVISGTIDIGLPEPPQHHFLVPTSGQPDGQIHTTQTTRQLNYDVFDNPSRQYHHLWHQYGVQNSGMFQPTTVTLSQVL